MPSTKFEGLSYPTHFLKNTGRVISYIFPEYISKHFIFGATKCIYVQFLLQIKQSQYLIGIVRAHIDIIYSKSITNYRKKSGF